MLESLFAVVLFYNFALAMEEKEITYRSIVAYKHYFHDFIIDQGKDVAKKYNAVFRYICTQQRIPVKFFRSLQGTDGLFEIKGSKSVATSIARSAALTRER